jgi:hypothetical protein
MIMAHLLQKRRPVGSFGRLYTSRSARREKIAAAGTRRSRASVPLLSVAIAAYDQNSAVPPDWFGAPSDRDTE